MSAASEYVKFGGLLGFTSVFLLVLLKDRDIVAAVFDASVACIVMAYVFKLLHGYIVSLHREVMREKQPIELPEADESGTAEVKSLSDSGNQT